MNIITVVPPPFEPVTVAEVYEHLRWDVEDGEGSPPEPFYPLLQTVTNAITAARRQVEQEVKRSLVEQTLRITYDYRAVDACRRIELLSPPLIAVESFGYFDAQNEFTTIAAEHYYLTDDLVPQLRLVEGFDVPWHDVYRRDDAVRVTYRAGYAPEGSPPTGQAEYAANVPQGLKQAILIGVQLLVDRFDANERADLTRAQAALLSPYTVYTF